MSFTLRPAVRENVPLIIGLIGGTGSGKTWTALELATGLARGGRIAGIDSENGRMKHYADHFKFDHGLIGPPFRPKTYTDALDTVAKAGYAVAIVDSTSHIWAGDGGVLDWHDEELERIAGKNASFERREACNMVAWVEPKGGHKRFVQRVITFPMHIILCFRAEPKIEMVKENNKWVVVPKPSKTGKDGWIPICEKNLPFELTMSLMFTDNKPGVPQPIKLMKDHRPLIATDQPITRATGAALADWATGNTTVRPPTPTTTGEDFITPDQCLTLETLCQDAGIAVERLRKAGGLTRLSTMPASKYADALRWIEDTKAKRGGEAA